MDNWEKRWHPLLEEWVILASTTNTRPWSGEKIFMPSRKKKSFDSSCYLCPGVQRHSGTCNPKYESTWSFTNDFSSFSFDAPNVYRNDILYKVEPAHGINRVICYSPWHNLTFAELSIENIRKVIKVWAEEYKMLASLTDIANVLIFENKGDIIGASNTHPHGQIYATNFVPRNVAKQRASFLSYNRATKSHLLVDLVCHELSYGSRIIYHNNYFVAFIPFFARFAYETYIVPTRQVSRISDLNFEELDALSDILKIITAKFDSLYGYEFPNSTILMNAPTDDEAENQLFHFHIEFYPPMRSRDKAKYVSGFDFGGGNIVNPVAPEEAAAEMRNAKF